MDVRHQGVSKTMKNDQAIHPTSGLNASHDVTATDAVSAACRISVLKPSGGDPRLPQSAIDEAEGDQLDLGAFDGDATITCAPWPLIAAGQKVWLTVDGTLADGSATTLALWTASEVVASDVVDGLSEALPRGWLESLLDDSSITLRLDVTLNGSTQSDEKIKFRESDYTLRTRGALEDFQTAPPGPFSGRLDLPLCTVSASSSNTDADATIEVDPSGDQYLSFWSSVRNVSLVTITPKRPTRSISFDYRWNSTGVSSYGRVDIYFENGSTDGAYLEGNGQYSSTAGEITKFRLLIFRSTLSIDNIRFVFDNF
jgi:hypothetical protein